MGWKESFRPTWKILALFLCFLLGAYLLISGVMMIAGIFIFLKSDNIDNFQRIQEAIEAFWYVLIGICIIDSILKRNFTYFAFNRVKIIIFVILLIFTWSSCLYSEHTIIDSIANGFSYFGPDHTDLCSIESMKESLERNNLYILDWLSLTILWVLSVYLIACSIVWIFKKFRKKIPQMSTS